MISLLPNDRRSRWSIAISALLALPLVVFAFWIWERMGAAPTVKLEGYNFQILTGEGVPAEGGVAIRRVGADGRALVALSVPDLSAENYAEVVFDVSGLESAAGGGVYWTNNNKPEVGHPRPLSIEDVQRGRLQLSGDPRWRGTIGSFGFIVQGPVSRDIVFRSIGFSAGSQSLADVARRLGSNWASLAEWDGGGVNFHIGASRTERLMTPALSVLLWAILTAALHGLFVLTGFVNKKSGSSVSLFVALILAGWAALDLRWQAELSRRHVTQAADAMLTADARRARALAEVKARFFDNDHRVFIVSDDPSGYVAYRTRYHLGATRSSFGMDRLPTESERRPGDYILVLGSRRPLTIDRRAEFIASDSETIPATLIVNSPDVGALLRIERGG